MEMSVYGRSVAVMAVRDILCFLFFCHTTFFIQPLCDGVGTIPLVGHPALARVDIRNKLLPLPSTPSEKTQSLLRHLRMLAGHLLFDVVRDSGPIGVGVGVFVGGKFDLHFKIEL